MKQYIKADPWSIIEEGYDPSLNEISESLFSIGNGAMGQRANFEETYSGKSLQGSYVGGIYYPDKTRVGWWKNGYPEYFAKVINATNWIGLNLIIDGEILDLAKAKQILGFRRQLDMKSGILSRNFKVVVGNEAVIEVNTQRFVSMGDSELGAISYKLTSNKDITLQLESYINGDVKNRDSNYDEKFWIPVSHEASSDHLFLSTQTKKTGYDVGIAASTELFHKNQRIDCHQFESSEFKASHHFKLSLKAGEEIEITKKAVVISSLNYTKESIQSQSVRKIKELAKTTFETLKQQHVQAWDKLWQFCDVEIGGDVRAQQGIRFNIFQLLQTYTGKDARLNIGPKGFTGEKYGGSTYWDTEAYCIPFYLSTAGSQVARNLLIYRHNQLGKAIENAQKLGFQNGAALFPMVTMNGEECHNEWEITFEEIHRNGAIAYAIYDYVRYTGDESYLSEYGLEVLIGIARFWRERVNWSQNKEKFVILGVTGPNEYENNVNNNWYTNYIAKWCLEYTTKVIEFVKKQDPQAWQKIKSKTIFKGEEVMVWQNIVDKLYLPFDHERQVYLQQDGFLDKELVGVDAIPKDQRPINQHWSWDRILRSCYIKQADVLQGLYFFEDHFTKDDIQKNFEFYEAMTVHESSLSPCVHVILASQIGKIEIAYELYNRTARLDLDNFNNDTEDGLHITSMAGTWMSVIKGFGGMRVKNDEIHFNPTLPEHWDQLSFKVLFRSNALQVVVEHDQIKVVNLQGNNLNIWVNNIKFELQEQSHILCAASYFNKIKSSAI
ncbi:MAG: glycoside hydrolase family 65 protein [Saprospiraceae bacterium]|nr:glycoside hydrolase family 65 protein [Saprospiraceae bacterium]